MAYQNQYAGGANDGAQQGQRPPPQSQYFQSYDLSHVTQPPLPRRRPYTIQQKAFAIYHLNNGSSAKTIAERIGGTCSAANPYRWRAEWQERQRQIEAWRADFERRAAAERAERERQRPWDRWDCFLLMIQVLLFTTDLTGIYLSMLPWNISVLYMIWALWQLVAFQLLEPVFGVPHPKASGIFACSFWVYLFCLIFNIGRSTPVF